MFNSNTKLACVNETIFYNDISTGAINSWEWAFEGGAPSTSTEQNPQVYYQNAGIYDVSLTITDGFGSATKLLNNYISIVGPPQIPATPVGDQDMTHEFTRYLFYTTTGSINADMYDWIIQPAEAGYISGNEMNATVIWTQNWEGTAYIQVRGYNEPCSFGGFSDSLMVNCHI